MNCLGKTIETLRLCINQHKSDFMNVKQNDVEINHFQINDLSEAQISLSNIFDTDIEVFTKPKIDLSSEGVSMWSEFQNFQRQRNNIWQKCAKYHY